MANKKRLCVLNGPPFGGKTTIIENLASYDVGCVDMSKLIKAKGEKDSAFAQLAEDLIVRGQLLPCDTVLDIYHEHIETSGYQKYVVCGMPRTPEQSKGMVSSPLLKSFVELCVIDISVSERVLRQRFEERQRKENRTDDTLENFQTRIQGYHSHRHPIMNVFHKHDKWRVRCYDGDGDNSAQSLAEYLVKTMNLKLKSAMLAQTN